jgi:hypothetical protein
MIRPLVPDLNDLNRRAAVCPVEARPLVNSTIVHRTMARLA